MKKIALIFLLALFLSGCLGYTTGSLLPAHLKAIAIPNFSNRTYEHGLEIDVTKKVIERFVFDGNLKIATEANADMILIGELLKYDRAPLRYTDTDTIEEYRVIITVNLVLKDLVKNKIMWRESKFTGEYTYYTDASQSTGAAGTSVGSEEEAKKEAMIDLARSIVNRTVEGW
ncbi:MAG: LptE family protein [Candidatus Omnitrophica bacterium]|nr:LptE family protein [Candidatus Omnitrophota bacterium]